MAKVKSITTTIEDEVVFMVDPKVEFVSLVKYGANRTPFKVLKEVKTKEESNMNKVVQSVLVRNDLSDEDIAKALEGIDKRSKQKFTSFTAYPQVSVEKINPETAVVVKHEDVDGIFFVLGDLAEGASEGGTLMVDAKEAVDYATLDNLYTELYAMADVVGGAMRQENADAEFRKSTILKAIDNFRTFAEVVLESLSKEKLEKGVDPADHPTLVVELFKEEKEDKKEDETDDDDKKNDTDDSTADDDKKNEDDKESTTSEDLFDKFTDKFNASLDTFGDKIVAAIGEVGKEVKKSNKATKESIEKIAEGVEEVKNTTLSIKSEAEEELEDGDEKGENVFKGILFSAK